MSGSPINTKEAVKPTEQVHDTQAEIALDVANELSFPASDPVSASNITRIEKAPETAPAADEHQNKNAIEETDAPEHAEK